LVPARECSCIEKASSAEALPANVFLKTNQKKSEYNRRFGDPVPAPVTTFVVALLTIALRTVVEDADGFACL
jgi:hypothetical protein